MAGTKDDHRYILGQLGFEQQGGDATAALAEAGGQGEPLQVRLAGTGGEHLPGDLHRSVFQVATADGQVLFLPAHQHLGPGVARRGALLIGHGDQYAGFASRLEVGQDGQPATSRAHAGSSVVMA